jgi:PA14 domain/Secretion system C-terminal sorting domain/Polysaccharide deacetylase
MNKKRYSLLLATTFLSTPLLLQAQTPVPTASFATWKDNKKAAYTIIHDDYGDVTTPGIVRYADTIAFNRGVRVNFGAITSVCDALDWTDAKRLITHGHEIINHSHNHLCAVQTPASTWCTNTYTDLATELGLSTQLIEQNTNMRPRFFIHPYDLASEPVHNYLRTLGYLGARAGDQAATNPANFSDYFKLNFFVYQPNFSLAQLNEGLLSAIATGGYSVQELHGIDDASWASVTLANYRSHLNLVKDKINSGDIWASTLGEVTSYKTQRTAYTPSAAYNATAKQVTVRFTTNQSVNTAVLKSPVTTNVGLSGLTYTTLTITQNGLPITDFKVTASGLAINAYPHQGSLVISGFNGGGSTGCEPNCPPTPCVVDGITNSEVWLGLTARNKNLTDLTSSSRFPASPTRMEPMSNISGFQRGDLGDNYGERVRGYLTPKTTGNYTFTLTGEDDVELWLGVDNNPATKRKIAGFTGFTTGYQFTKYPGQKSAPIALVAGKSYYLEVLHIATGTGVDYFGVHWQTPTDNTIRLIKSEFLSSKPCGTTSTTPQQSSTRDIFAFDGFKRGNKAILNWVNNTAASSTDYFVVEKLLTAGSFKELDHINADMNAGETRYFTFTDENTVQGDNVYRVKLVNQNGQARYSELIKLSFDSNKWRIYPNPAQDYVELDLQSRENQAATIEIYDPYGRVVYSKMIDKIPAHPYRLELERDWNMGQYWVRVHTESFRDLVAPLLISKE